MSAVLLLVASSLAQSVAGLKWAPPAAWKAEEGSRPMRAATYTVLPASGDTANAECVVYFFGAGQGGSIDANLERWKGKIVGPDGKPAEAKIAKGTVDDPVTTIDSSGDYNGMGGPMAASVPCITIPPRRHHRRSGRKCLSEIHRPRQNHRGQSSRLRKAGERIREREVTNPRKESTITKRRCSRFARSVR
jgi:hypothetical protein